MQIRIDDVFAEEPMMKRQILLLGLSVIAGTLVLPAATAAPDTSSKPSPMASYGKLPLSFEPNRGQINPEAKFLSRGPGYTLFLTPTELVLALPAPQMTINQLRQAHYAGGTTAIRMKFLGANPGAEMVGERELPGRSNYFIGNDPSKWRTAIPQYARVRYESVYPGVDLLFYGDQGQLEYDFVLAPGVDPENIQVAFEGIDQLVLDADGNLILHLTSDAPLPPGAELRFRKPRIYQSEGSALEEVSGAFKLLAKNQVGFEVGAYDPTRPLIVDPVLVYSTYLGGNADEIALEVALDSAGNAYVTGITPSPDFPTTAGAWQPTKPGFVSAFVTKLNATGTALIYSTYLGGSFVDLGIGITVDSAGQAYVTGGALSSDFPTTPGAFQTALSGSQDAFVVKLNTTGTALLYSTYLGGSGTDAGIGIAVDSGGNAHISGLGDSPDFPTTPGAFQATYGGGSRDVFVTKLDPSGGALIYSTYLGGSAGEEATRIALDPAGNAYVSGYTASPNFPTTPGAFQTTFGGGGPDPFGDAFVTKLDPTGTALVYSTYLGGSAADLGNFVTLDSEGNLYLSGGTASANFPTTPGAFQTTFQGASQPSPFPPALGGAEDAFVLKLNPTGTALVYSTFLGGATGADFAGGMRLDAAQNAYVAGNTASSDFPVTPDAFQASFGGGCGDAFVTKLNATGTGMVYSTYLGGNGVEGAVGLAVDGGGNVYVTGFTASANFPTTPGAFQTTFGGGTGCGPAYSGGDAYVAKLEPPNTPEGAGVPVQPIDSATGSTPVELTFDQVTQSGETSLQTSDTGSEPPAGFALGDPATYYELTTTATFTGMITVCIDYSAVAFSDESALRLFHFEGGVWSDVTSPGFPDVDANIICGEVSSLSPFAVLQETIQPVGLQPPLAALVPEGDEPPLPGNAFKTGSTLSLRLQLLFQGVFLTDADVAAPRIVSLVREGNAIDLQTIDLDSGAANDNGLVFRFSEGNWVYNLSTRGLSTGTYGLTIELPDGFRYSARFVVR